MSTLAKSKFHNITIICELNSYPLISLPLSCHKTLQKRARPVGRALCLRFAKEPFLQVLLVALDHLFDHLAADRAGLAGGQIAVVALLEVDADLPWCVFTTKTQFYFEVNTHQGGLMFFDLLKICYPCYIPYRVFCDFSNKAVKDTNTLPVGSSRPSNR